MIFRTARALAILLTFTLIASEGIAQSWRFTGELGINGGGFGSSRKLGIAKEKTTPIVSPIVGVHLQRQMVAGLYVGAMARFTQSGDQVITRSKTDVATMETVQRMRFQKLSYGVSASYRFRIGKTVLEATPGFRWYYLTDANYYYRFTADLAGQDLHSVVSYNPLNDASLTMKGNRHGTEFFLAAGVSLANHIGFQVQYAVPDGVVFTRAEPGASFDAVYTANEYRQNDWSMSVLFTL